MKIKPSSPTGRHRPTASSPKRATGPDPSPPVPLAPSRALIGGTPSAARPSTLSPGDLVHTKYMCYTWDTNIEQEDPDRDALPRRERFLKRGELCLVLEVCTSHASERWEARVLDQHGQVSWTNMNALESA